MDRRIINKKLQILEGLAVTATVPVGDWEVRTADYLAPGDYRYDGDWAPVSLPASFAAGKTVLLRGEVTVPAEFELADTYLSFDFAEFEGLLSFDDAPYAGMDWQHHRVLVPRGGALELNLEFMSQPAIYCHPETLSKPGQFSGGQLVLVDREIEAFYYAARFAAETAEVVSEPRRRGLLDAAVEAAMLAVDLTLPRLRLREEVARARQILAEKLAAIQPDPESGSLFAVGHSHIDTAWLWPIRETVRKCSRTFSTACRLLERFPEFVFNCSQPQLYRYTQQHYPALYEEIKHWVAEGRWETAGAMWVEADCNVTGGEALIRQMLYGLDFFRREFGTRTRICWLPDVFGYPSSLPEILAGCGVEYFYTYKLHWQATNHFPDHLFRWRGLDGSEVLAHVVSHLGGYNCTMSPEHLQEGWQRYAQKTEYPEVLFPFGHGDGGGGVTEGYLEMYRQAEGRYPGLPAVRMGTAERFFDDAAAAAPDLPLWDGELYVETHRGTYTTQSEMKRANRACELLLREAEIWGSLAAATGARADFGAAALRAAWEQVLVNQFHDILPGSSIGMVYTQALAELAAVQQEAQQQVDASLAALAPGSAGESLCLFNSLSWPRRDLMSAPVAAGSAPQSVVAADGTAYPAQVVAGPEGAPTLLFAGAEVPALGYACFTPAAAPVAAAELTVTPTLLENARFRVELSADGGLTRLYDKLHEREVLAPDAVGNDLQLLQDGPENEDAWNIHATSDKRHYSWEGVTTIEVRESGPVRGVVRVRRSHRDSTVEQDLIIYAGLERLDFVTRVDWQERQTMLKVAFPLAVRSTHATYEVQFGAYERPTHRNTSWDQQKFEVAGHRWADLSEAGYGVSLLNDSRYGWDAQENVLRLTLLRGTTFPDPEADRGRHEFTYSLLPHAGGWVEAETVRRAAELNVPARAVSAPAAAAPASFLTLEGLPAVVEALKPAEDGRGLILRLYEPHGARGAVTVRLSFPVASVLECNHVEEDAAPLDLTAGGFRCELQPFQIRSFRLLTG
ncbi:MAG TPA: alpha-mannosidase [Armatimonadota bacterium]|jgi:alpha-mannosidase